MAGSGGLLCHLVDLEAGSYRSILGLLTSYLLTYAHQKSVQSLVPRLIPQSVPKVQTEFGKLPNLQKESFLPSAKSTKTSCTGLT